MPQAFQMQEIWQVVAGYGDAAVPGGEEKMLSMPPRR